MALSNRTKQGVILAAAVLAGLFSVLLSLVLLAIAGLLIAWGQAPQRTEEFIGQLPYGAYLQKALVQIDQLLAPGDIGK